MRCGVLGHWALVVVRHKHYSQSFVYRNRQVKLSNEYVTFSQPVIPIPYNTSEHLLTQVRQILKLRLSYYGKCLFRILSISERDLTHLLFRRSPRTCLIVSPYHTSENIETVIFQGRVMTCKSHGSKSDALQTLQVEDSERCIRTLRVEEGRAQVQSTKSLTNFSTYPITRVRIPVSTRVHG